MYNKDAIKSAFESMMFVWGEPLDAKDAADAFGVDKKIAIECFEELKKEYENKDSGIRIREIDGAFQFVTFEGNEEYIQKLCTPVKIKRLSQPALEVLAIIAYKQPVTRVEIDSIRGVKSDRAIDGLMNKGLVKETGRSDSIGRPILYATTEMFLRHFNFESIKDLPEIEDIENVIAAEEQSSQITIEEQLEAKLEEPLENSVNDDGEQEDL